MSLNMFVPPNENNVPPAIPVDLTDTPELRAWAEENAIPKCRTWREANPEDGPGYPDGPDQFIAPYCCSAYCPRCGILRHLDGVEPLRPNEWMWQA